MDTTAVINILLHGNQLKRTPRTGWVQRGVPNAENVAAHSFGVVYAILVLAPLVNTDINLERALAMAALHDLPESLTTDIPTPAWRFLPADIKTAVERRAMQEMLGAVVTKPVEETIPEPVEAIVAELVEAPVAEPVEAEPTEAPVTEPAEVVEVVEAQFMTWWEELHANETAEALLVHDADKIDMFLQALMYEKQTGNQHLAEFWTKPFTFNYPECQAVYNELRARRS
jgi:putative hydrolase of HD superfamily